MTQQPADPYEAPVPGAGENLGVEGGGSPAGAQNADNTTTGPPDQIPYARFKEVNDRLNALKGYESLAELGYDPDSLGRLAEFEAQLLQNPTETWLTVADNLDLPDDLKDVISRHRGDAEGDDTGGEQETAQSDAQGQEQQQQQMPDWAEPLLQDYQDRQVQAEHAARKEVLDEIISKWDEADRTDGIETPMNVKLSFIAAHAAEGTSVDDIAQSARTSAMGYRNDVLKSEVRVPGVGGLEAPRPVPSSGASGGSEPLPLRTLADATAAARAALERSQS